MLTIRRYRPIPLVQPIPWFNRPVSRVSGLMTMQNNFEEELPMTSLTRPGKIILLAIAMLLAAATSGAQKPPIAEQIAKTYGLDSRGQVEAIRYTFNIPAFKISRTWTWEPDRKSTRLNSSHRT